jgi:hypothetical protein
MRDYIDRSRSLAEKLSGESPDEVDEHMPSTFALYSARRRSEILESIEASTPTGELELEDLDKAMRKADLRKRLEEVHAQLRRINR